MLNSSNHSWRDIGSKKRQHTQDKQSSSSVYRRSQKFDPENKSKRSDTDSKYFKLNAINHSQSMIIRDNRLNYSKDSNSPVKPSRLVTQVWQKDSYGVQSGITILTQGQFANQNREKNEKVLSRSDKRYQNKSNLVIKQIQQQFKSFKQKVFDELRLMQERMNQVINDVIGSYNNEVQKIDFFVLQKQKKMMQANIDQKMNELIGMEVLSPVKKVKKNKFKEVRSMNSNQSYNVSISVKNTSKDQSKGNSPLQRNTTVQHGKKQDFNRFMAAIQRLKQNIQQMNQINKEEPYPKSPSFKIPFANVKMR